MAGQIGNIESFNENIETWESYSERFEQYLVVNRVPGERKVSALISSVGPTTYSLQRDLTCPEKPSTKTYNELLRLLRNHHSPPPNLITERCRFHSRFQEEGESVLEFVAALRKLSEHCNFGETLSETIRDRLVCGLRNTHIQKRLLSHSDPYLTLNRTIEISVAMETAGKDTLELQARYGRPVKQPEESNQVNRFKQSDTRQRHNNCSTTSQSLQSRRQSDGQRETQNPCSRCLGINHSQENCPYLDTKCLKCHKKGHLARACRTGKSSKYRFKNHRRMNNLGEDNLTATIYQSLKYIQ
ncbi:hypothetical protein SNE40_018386 [Patella caerulea]|uniref:CCHC-type domain-containing protein n=1 Tax=Patella caerulea TaxID=87958 RepID=A0AAN8J8M2_PATCE